MDGINKKEYIARLLQSWSYVNGSEGEALLGEISDVYGVTEAERLFLTGNGRTAQYLFLKSLNLPAGSNVVIQGYTCNAAVGPIFWAGLTPKYVDINPEDYSLSLESLKNVVDENTKVIILQHTYGIPGPIDEVIDFAHERGILVFEDTAHSLGMKGGDGHVLGTKGDATLISFGIDKVLNTRVGGALLVNNSDLIEGVKDMYKDVKVMGFFDSMMWMMNPLVWFILAKFKGLRKKIARSLTKIGILNMGFYSCEFRPQMPKQYPRRLSNVLSWFVREELNKLDRNLAHRKEVVRLYSKEFAVASINGVEFKEWGIPMVKYPILLPNPEVRNEVYKRLLAKGYLVSMWYDPVIFPDRENKGLGYVGYSGGSCPNSEAVSKRILALPTGMNVNEESVKDIVSVIARVING
jgi:perosamine synthetase